MPFGSGVILSLRLELVYSKPHWESNYNFFEHIPYSSKQYLFSSILHLIIKKNFFLKYEFYKYRYYTLSLDRSYEPHIKLPVV